MKRSLIVAVAIALGLATSLVRISADGNTALATGSGQIHAGSPPELRTFSFTARTDGSGVSSGQWELLNRSLDIRAHGNVDCLSVSGNVATIGGQVTEIDPSTPPNFVVGNFVVFQVIDNGQGSNAPPDLISLVFFFPTGSPNPGCTGFGTFATTPVEHGNIQVH